MSITGLMRRLSLIGIDAIWQLNLGCLLMRTISSFLRYTGYLNFINGPICRVLLLILAHVQLLSIPMGTNCAPHVADLFCFTMRETLCCLCQTIIKLIFL